MSKRILSLDVGAGGVKLAEFTCLKDGSLELLRYGTAPLGVDPANEDSRSSFLVSSIVELLADTGIKPGPVLLSVSGQSVFSRYVKLPAVDSEKIYNMVRYEAQQNVPFPIEEVEWDYQILNRSGEEIEVLLVAIKKEILAETVDAVTRAGLVVDVVDVAPMAIFNTVRKNYPDLEGCTLVLDMGSRSTNLIFIDEGKVFSRSIPVAGNAITQQIMKEFELDFDQAEQLKLENAVVSFGGAFEPLEDEVQEKVSKCVRGVMTRMHMEITRSINFYRGQQSGNSPAQILLTGGTSIIPHADTFLSEKLEIPVDYLNPFQSVTVSEQIPGESIESDAHKLSEVVGLALRGVSRCPIELNLMPKAILKERDAERRQPVVFAGLVCFLAAVLAWAGYTHVQATREQASLEKVEAEVQGLRNISQQITAKEGEIGRVKAQIGEIQKIADQRSQWNDLLDLIRTPFPEGAWITSLESGPALRTPDSGPLPGESGAAPEAGDHVAQLAAVMAGGAPGASAASPAGKTEHAIQIKGLFYEDLFQPSKLTDYVEGLKKSPLVSPKTSILQRKQPKPGEVVRGFWIQVVLNQQLPQ